MRKKKKCLNTNTLPVDKITMTSSFKVGDVNLRDGPGVRYCKSRDGDKSILKRRHIGFMVIYSLETKSEK